MPSDDRCHERGVSLVALMASITIMLILMAVAVPSWHYVVQNEKEEELIFRGVQVMDAIQRYQRKNGNALPTTIEMLVKGRYLRKAYKDPMTKGGKWRVIRQGEPLVPVTHLRTPEGATPPPTTVPIGGGEEGFGPIIGVASRSTEKALRVLTLNGNRRTRYHEWAFRIDVQQIMVGATLIRGQAQPGMPGAPGAPGGPGAPPPAFPGVPGVPGPPPR